MGKPLELLAGIRVDSLEQYISAPYASSLLADAGAEVIKIERPPSGDPRRGFDPLVTDDDGVLSGGFASYNRGKLSATLDLATPGGRESLVELLATADVLLSNLRPGALDRLGLSPVELAQRYPRLIICEITGFGVNGGASSADEVSPAADRPAFDSVIQAMSGLSSLLARSPNDPPGLAPMGTMDVLSGAYATIGILMALVARERTGRGGHVDAAMYDIGAAFLERPLTLHEFTGEPPVPGHDRFSPVGSFRAGDGGWVSLVIPTDHTWQRCCAAIGRPDLVDDPVLSTVLGRAANMDSLILPALESWAATMTRDEAARVLSEAGQPAGIVQTIDEVRNDPLLARRGLFQPIEDPRAIRSDGTRMKLPRLPLLFDGVGAVPGPIPPLADDFTAP